MSIEKEIRKNVLAIANAYRRATGLSLATVSARFYGNAGFLAEFKAGRQTISVKKLDEFLAHIRSKWPEGLPWPSFNNVPMEGRERRKKTPAKTTTETAALSG